MSRPKVYHTVVFVLAAIGALAVVVVIGMWLMHRTMMGGMMGIEMILIG